MRHKNFFILPNRIFEFGLKPKELAVYSCLVRHSDKDGSCFPSRSTIAKEFKLPEQDGLPVLEPLMSKAMKETA